jgi:hypothetical protein
MAHGREPNSRSLSRMRISLSSYELKPFKEKEAMFLMKGRSGLAICCVMDY